MQIAIPELELNLPFHHSVVALVRRGRMDHYAAIVQRFDRCPVDGQDHVLYSSVDGQANCHGGNYDLTRERAFAILNERFAAG